jgi:hypothetical protein
MRLSRTILALVISLAIPFSLLGRPATTSLAKDDPALEDQPILATIPILGKELPITVGGQTFVFNEMVLVSTADPAQGYFTGRPSVFAMQAAPAQGEFAEKVIPYLLKSPEFADVLKLRRSARLIRAREVAANVKTLAKGDPRADEMVAYLKAAVGTPLIVTERAPMPEYIRKAGAGPCNISAGAGLVVDGKTVVSDGNIVCISDLLGADDKVMFSIDESIKNDTLDIVLCHETGHAIMGDLYGKFYNNFKRPSNNGHMAPVITDLSLAWIEGWAEAFEAIYGPNNPNIRKADMERLKIAEFLFERQDPVRRERYIWETVGGKPTGVLKNGLQMLCTEGVVAGVLYDLLSNRAITAPSDKILTIMARFRPMDLRDAINGWLKAFPDDRRVVLRVVLENTNYVTMDGQAAGLYYAYYQKKLAMQQKRGSREDYEVAKKAFVDHKEALFQKAMGGADLFANVAPELWFSGLVVAAKPRELTNFEMAQLEARKWLKMGEGKFNPNRWEFNLDLNTVTPRMLKRIGIPAEPAAAILAERKAKGFFTGDPLAILRTHLGAGYAAWAKRLQIAPMDDPDKKPNAIARLMTLFPEDLDLP